MRDSKENPKGSRSVLPFPQIWEEYQEQVNMYKRSGQNLADAWGANRRAFLTSCIEDLTWMDDESTVSGITFYENVKKPRGEKK